MVFTNTINEEGKPRVDIYIDNEDDHAEVRIYIDGFPIDTYVRLKGYDPNRILKYIADKLKGYGYTVDVMSDKIFYNKLVNEAEAKKLSDTIYSIIDSMNLFGFSEFKKRYHFRY